MFGRTVKIDGLEIHVSCTPSTPLWDVLQRAANQVKAWQSERAALTSHLRRYGNGAGRGASSWLMVGMLVQR